jgi:4-amino-4-deoxy-L-arabinose transferase-like glycosyltransferase
VEREFREASDMRPSIAGLAIVLVTAAALRFWGLGHGIPAGVGQDEAEIMNRAVAMMRSGDFNPHFFGHPALYMYVQMAVASLRFLAGAGSGSWTSVAQVSAGNFYLWGRVVSALLGVATVYVVYLIGSRWGARHALLAAGLVAVMPNQVQASHSVAADVAMTFFVMLTFLLALRALEQPNGKRFALAGVMAGLAGGTLYSGGLALAAPLVAAWFVTNPPRPRRTLALASIGAAAGVYLLVAPYTILDLPGFLDGFVQGRIALSSQAGGWSSGLVAWLKTLNLSLWYSGIALAVWGAVHAIVRAITGPGKARFTLLILVPALYSFLVFDDVLVSPSSLTPLFPFISLLIAIAIVSGVSLLRRFNIPRPVRTALIVALTVVAILPPAIGAVAYDHGAATQVALGEGR